MKEAVLVIDVGTSKVHAAVIDLMDGESLRNCSAGIPWEKPAPGRVQCDPNSLFFALETAAGAAVSGLDGIQLTAVACSFQGDAFCLLDRQMGVLHPFVLAMDRRGEACLQQMGQTLGEERFEEILGCPFSPREPAKYLWMALNHPQLLSKTAHLVSVQQYVMHRLGLGLQQDVTAAAHKVMMDVRTGQWSEPLCRMIGIDPALLGPAPVLTDTLVGEITHIGAVPLGNPLPVMIGGHDCGLGMIGLGASAGGRVLANVAGTTDHLGLFTTEYRRVSTYGLTSYRGPFPESFVPLGAENAGGPLSWAMETFSGGLSYDEVFDALPLNGTGSLYCIDPAIGTGLAGFRGTGTPLEHIGALVECITYRLALKCRCLEEVSGGFDWIAAGGGGARLEKWLSLKASIFGKPVVTVQNNEVSAVGAAILAAVRLGYYSSCAEAQRAMVRTGRVLEPKQADAARYAQRLEEWKQLGGV